MLIFRNLFSKTAALTLMIALLSLALLETALRTAAITQHLPPPTLTQLNSDFNYKYAQLEQFAAQHGGVDCIIVGSSLVLNGLNPQQMAHTYQTITGQPQYCYNFGLGFLTPSTMEALAQLLIQDFAPKLLIIGFTWRDFEVFKNIEGFKRQERLVHTNWMRYRRGEWNYAGWLTQQSALYRYYHTLNQTYLLTGSPTFVYINTDPTGYQTAWNFREYAPRYYPLATFQPNSRPIDPRPIDLEAMKRFGQLRTETTQVLVLEMPVTPAYKTMTLGSVEAYDLAIDNLFSADSLPLWRTQHFISFDPWDWIDYFHLFLTGNLKFSDWLGQQLAALYPHGWQVDQMIPNQPPLAQAAPAALMTSYDQWGLSAAQFSAYQESTPPVLLDTPETIFNPAPLYPITRQSQLLTLGLGLEFYAARKTYAAIFEVLYLLEHTRHEEELTLSPAQQQALTRWRTTKAPNDLQAAGFRYLLVTNFWWEQASEGDRTIIQTHYTAIGQWSHPLEKLQYYLFAIPQ